MAADWWSFGAIVYEMLCGLPPFYSSDRKALLRSIQIEAPDFDKPFLSAEAKDLCAKLLHKDPEARLGFNSVDEIKSHPWFDGLIWKQIEEKKTPPPYKPQLDGVDDTKHFFKEFTKMGLSP